MIGKLMQMKQGRARKSQEANQRARTQVEVRAGQLQTQI